MPNIGAPELIIIAVALIVLFGATKLPTFARSIGRSMRIFKSEVKGLQKDDDADESTTAKADGSAESGEKAESKATPELTEAKTPSADTTTATPSQQSTEQR